MRWRPPEAAVIRAADKLRWLERPVPLAPGCRTTVVAVDVTLEIPDWLRELEDAS
jgi:hypothetical protein